MSISNRCKMRTSCSFASRSGNLSSRLKKIINIYKAVETLKIIKFNRQNYSQPKIVPINLAISNWAMRHIAVISWTVLAAVATNCRVQLVWHSIQPHINAIIQIWWKIVMLKHSLDSHVHQKHKSKVLDQARPDSIAHRTIVNAISCVTMDGHVWMCAVLVQHSMLNCEFCFFFLSKIIASIPSFSIILFLIKFNLNVISMQESMWSRSKCHRLRALSRNRRTRKETNLLENT